jgi:hypothetical protein
LSEQQEPCLTLLARVGAVFFFTCSLKRGIGTTEESRDDPFDRGLEHTAGCRDPEPARLPGDEPLSQGSRRKKSNAAEKESPCIKHNEVGVPFSIKLMPAAFYHEIDLYTGQFQVRFPESKANLAVRLDPGDYIFVYVMAPEKRVIGLATVVEPASFVNDDDRWPYRLVAEWEIGPKFEGLTFQDLGIKVRPRIGDTIYSIHSDKAMDIADALRGLPDLTSEQLDSYRSKYAKEG